MGTTDTTVNRQKHICTHRQKSTLTANWNAVSSGESRLCVSINSKCCTESEASNGVKLGSDSGHDSIVTAANELLTRESEDPIPHSLCVMFALNTLISELRKRQTRNWRERSVELSQVSVGLARTSLGWINITLRLRKILELG